MTTHIGITARRKIAAFAPQIWTSVAATGAFTIQAYLDHVGKGWVEVPFCVVGMFFTVATLLTTISKCTEIMDGGWDSLVPDPCPKCALLEREIERSNAQIAVLSDTVHLLEARK